MFKIGDGVEYVGPLVTELIGHKGTVRAFTTFKFSRDTAVNVRFDHMPEMETNINPKNLKLLSRIEPVEVEEINDGFYRGVHAVKIIYNNPDTTLLYQVEYRKKLKRCVARCSPEDTYSKVVGKRVAINKAMIRELQRENKVLTK